MNARNAPHQQTYVTKNEIDIHAECRIKLRYLRVYARNKVYLRVILEYVIQAAKRPKYLYISGEYI